MKKLKDKAELKAHIVYKQNRQLGGSIRLVD